MKHYDLFPTRVWKTKIDSSLYEKKNIVNTIEKNYSLNPSRNSHFYNSHLHAYYNDWDNKNFEQIKCDSLLKIYENEIQKWVKSLKFKKVVNYNFFVININAMKYGQFMHEHDHIDYGKKQDYKCTYSCVHYIKYNKKQPPTTFVNPTIFGQYALMTSHMMSYIDTAQEENSVYLKDWWFNTEEDDFIIFPSYLKHKVDYNENQSYDDLRITSAINILFEVDEK